MVTALLARLRGLSPAATVRLFPWAAGAGAVLSLIVLQVQRWWQPQSDHFYYLAAWSSIVLLVALVLGSARAASEFALPPAVDRDGFKAWMLSLQTALVLLAVPVFLRVWITDADYMTGWTYPYLSKRWLTALFWLGVATVLVLPHLWGRVLTGRDSDRPGDSVPPPASRFGVARLAAGVLVALCIAWFWVGPPWRLERRHAPIDFHEQVHLGPLQAIDKGYVPFIGPASTMYGPGSQVLTYAFMKQTGRFDIVGFRTAALAFHFFAFFAVAVIAYVAFGLWAMVLITLLGVTFSPLALYWAVGESMNGFFGWGNTLRYLAPMIVVPALARLAIGRPRATPDWPAVVLGMTWGFFSWVAQENLLTTVAASALVMLLLWLTDTASLRRVLSLAVFTVAGWAIVWSIVLAYYAWHGMAADFVRNYFMVAGAIVQGFQNTWWSEGPDNRAANAYYYTAPFALALGAAALCDLRRLALRRRLDERQVRLLVFVVVLLACYQTTLYRSDSTHVLNTMMALPFVLVAGLLDLPAMLARTWPVQTLCRVVFVAVALWIFPLGASFLELHSRLPVVASRFDEPPAMPDVIKDGREPFRRATRYLADEPFVAAGMMPMRPYLEGVSELRALVGTRKTFIDGVVAGAYTGLHYFMADLTPGPQLFETEMMTINTQVRDQVLAHFTQNAARFECVIALTPDTPIALAFLKAHPDAAVVERSIADRRFVVLLAPSGQS